MCLAMLADGDFDPELCPLLAGLSPEARARRLGQPWAKACIDRRKVRVAAPPQPAGCESEPGTRPVPCVAMAT